MDEQFQLQCLHKPGMEEGKSYLGRYFDELERLEQSEQLKQYAIISTWLEKEALDRLYSPFDSLKLAELLIFLGQHVCDRVSQDPGLVYYALGLKAKGDALVQLGHFKVAMESLDEAGTIFLQQGDERNWARSRISWIVGCAWSGDIEEALREGQQAREMFLRLGEPFWVGKIDNNIAVIYDHAGRYQEALELYRSMQTLYLSVTDQDSDTIRAHIAYADHNQAINLAWVGHFGQAYALQRQARDSFRELGEANLEQFAEVSLADLDYMQGYYGSALRRYYQALDILQHSPPSDLARIAKLKLWTADCLVKLNRAHEARQLSHEAVTICRQFDISLNTGLALLTHATTLVACKQVEQAIDALTEAQELFHRGGFEHYTITAQLQRVELQLETSDAFTAYTQAQLLRGACESRGLVAYVVRAELVMANSLLASATDSNASAGQRDAWLQEAVQLCKHLAKIAHKHNLQEATYKSYYFLGRIASFQGNVRQTGRYYRAAIAQIELILDDLLYDLSPAFLRTTWAVYVDMIAFCLEQGHVERAFTYLEQARSMALRQYLSPLRETKEQYNGDASVSIMRLTRLRIQGELKNWQDSYRHYSTLLSHFDPSVSMSVNRETIKAELRRCESNISELFERLSLYQEEWPLSMHTSRGTKRPERRHVDLAQLRQNLAEHQTVLAYFLHKQQLIIFAMNAQTLICHEIPDGGEQLEGVLPFLHARIQMGLPLHEQPSQQQIIRKLLQKLYTLLIAPVHALLPEPSGLLTIVPYGPLHSLPFHALFDGARFLIEDFQIHYLPASTMLSFSHAPDHASETCDESRRSNFPLLFGYSGDGQLPHALEEAKLLTDILQGTCYLEKDATITRLEQEAPGSSLIHIATHGENRLDAPNFSSVLLADGKLNAIDAFNLNLRDCELVTLSGCETGLSLIGGGDEQLGLGRAFLAAGAKTLVMSLWPVEDKRTCELMEIFYRNLLQGASKVQALRLAQCEFLSRSESAYAHPYFWAAFRLVGDIHPLNKKSIREKEDSQRLHF